VAMGFDAWLANRP